MKLNNYLYIFLLFFTVNSCYKETEIPLNPSFDVVFKNGDESVPVYMELTNKSSGGEGYFWEFDGGIPKTSTDKNPGSILYTKQGNYKIKLTITNEHNEKATFEKEITVKDAIEIGFTKEILQSNYPPVEVKITNTTKGENFTYKWLFENGNPSNFDGINPPNVIFSQSGNHKITLLVSNGYEEKSFSELIEVNPEITTDFSWETAWEDYDYQAPVKISLENNTQNAISYNWTFQGGTPATSQDKNPQITYSKAGTYTIELISSNGKLTKKIQKEITILPNTGIYIFKDIRLGINYAHNTQKISAFYSTKLRKSFFSNEINSDNAPFIDIVFQGYSPTFLSNRFVSPTQVQNYGFKTITGATSTIFVNSQEICNCGLHFTENDFEAMQNDIPLKPLNITHTAKGFETFSNTLPRVVLFQTHDGRKGAIKINKFVNNDTDNSYILCDIKVQK